MTDKQTTTPPHVYKAIAAITAEMAKDGISKDRKNDQQNYKFRGIDDVYNALAPMLAANNLCILPEMMSRTVDERQTKNGGTLFNVTVDVNFHFVSAIDGSKHIVRMYGEAMDSADKATNKAMSAAYKYACIQAFCIPTEGDNDADGTTHEPLPKQNKAPPVQQSVQQLQPAKEPTFKSTEQALAWMQSAKTFIQGLHSPEDIANWLSVNGKFVAELKPKQREWIDDVITKRRAAVIQAPIKVNGAAKHA